MNFRYGFSIFYLHQDEAISGVNSSSELLSFEELQNLTSALRIDWFKIINNLLLSDTKDVEILVENPQMIKRLADLIAATDKK